MDTLVKGACERIRAACEGKPVGVVSYSCIRAGDVVTVVNHLAKTTAIDGVIEALLRGAVNNPPNGETNQTTEHLRYLLEQVAG